MKDVCSPINKPRTAGSRRSWSRSGTRRYTKSRRPETVPLDRRRPRSAPRSRSRAQVAET